MSSADREHEVANKAVAADQRFRAVLYSILFIAFSMFSFATYELLQLRGDSAQINRQVQEKSTVVLTRIEKLIADAGEQNLIQNEETRRFNDCLLVVPLEQRSPEAKRSCLNQADLPGGGNLKEEPTLPPENAATGIAKLSVVSSAPEDQIAITPIPASDSKQSEEISQEPSDMPADTAPPSEEPSPAPTEEVSTTSLLQAAEQTIQTTVSDLQGSL